MRRSGCSSHLTTVPKASWLKLGLKRSIPHSNNQVHHSVSCNCRTSATKTAQQADDSKSVSQLNNTARQRDQDRNLFYDVLNATASRREAKSYLANFRPKGYTKAKPAQRITQPDTTSAWGNEVNLGSLYLPIRAIDQSPKFTRHVEDQSFTDPQTEALRTALVLIRLDKESTDDSTLQSIGRTFSQLARLGMLPVIVVDTSQLESANITDTERRSLARQQATRVVSAIESIKGQRASLADSGLEIVSGETSVPASIKVNGRVRLGNRARILKPLRRNAIPVLAPLAFDTTSYKVCPVTSSEAVLAVARDFAGLSVATMPEESKRETERPITLDRLIILDAHGGIPRDGVNSWHVFVNLEQEFDSIRAELKSSTNKEHSSKTHRENLELSKDVLSLLPPTSSAFITTPEATAHGSKLSSEQPGVGTRTRRNPLIHNLLTDKPVFSSSLPASRLSHPLPHHQYEVSKPPTFLKRGMPITIFPNPLQKPWTPPSASNPPLSLSSPQVDLPRLIHLIEDSFQRPLDAKAYFNRIAPRLAGIIVAGAYEGCAILTWEIPPSLAAPDTSDGLSNDLSDRCVPYLDKFAVLQRSQGTSGVADILFNGMVRDCFPDGVVWRSRSNNPVNKWYFERARGSWRIPVAEKGAQSWTMFWTTAGVEGSRFLDYEEVCGSIGTCWADGKKTLD